MKKAIVIATIFLTVFSQIALTGYERYIMYMSWVLMLTIGIGNKVSNTTKLFAIVIFFYNGYACLNHYFWGTYEEYPLFAMVLIPPAIVTLSSDLCSDIIKGSLWEICIAYFCAALLLAFWKMFFTSFRVDEWSDTMQYTMEGKNSIAQILAIGCFLGLYLFFRNRNNTIRLLLLGGVIFLVITMLYAQSRTALIGVITSLCVITIGYGIVYRKTKVLFGLSLLIVIILGICYSNEQVNAFINHSFLIDKYQGGSVDDFSSMRIAYFRDAYDIIASYPLGIGKYYVDCFYLQILTETGIIGLILILSLFAHQIYIVLALENNKEKPMLIAMCLFYLVESVGEAYPPFGPGVSSFMFWFLTTALTKKQSSESESISNSICCA